MAKPALHPDVYPIGRVSTEFFLRGFEVVGQVDDDVLSGMIVITLWCDTLVETGKTNPIGIRELSRRLDFPFATVRRHIRELVRKGACLADKDGVILAAPMRRSARMNAMLRKLYLEAVRMLGELARIKVGSYKPSRSPSYASRHMSKEFMVIAVAAIRVLLAALKVLRGSFGGDLMTGLVFTAIRAANVKHITNKAPAAIRDILPDADRQPVSMMAISNSMRLPYETIRRHTQKLIKQGKCIRVGRDGLIAPGSAFHKMTAEANMVRQLVLGFLAELRAGGVKV